MIVETVHTALNNSADLSVLDYKPYIDIIEDCGGLEAFDIHDPLIYEYKLNKSTHPKSLRTDYSIVILFVRLLSWAKEVSPMITCPELSTRTCSFEELKYTQHSDSILTSPSSAAQMPQLTNLDRMEQLKVLFDSITYHRPGLISFYSLYQNQSQVKPMTPPRMEDMTYDDIQNFFLSITGLYQRSTLFAESLPLSCTYTWYPKSIKRFSLNSVPMLLRLILVCSKPLFVLSKKLFMQIFA